MKPYDIKRQAGHYLAVLKWMLSSYYQQEKQAFWLIQVLMGLSVGLGLMWLLGILAGLNHLNDSQYLQAFKFAFLFDFFNLPLWAWLGILSVAGLLSAGAMFLSFHLGVKSIIRYQVNVLHLLLETINQKDQFEWLSVVDEEPRKKTHRIIKMSVQMTGLVVRRLVRMLIPLLTFVVAFVALIKLDGRLLLNLVPLAVIYLVALYYINRHAARNQVKLTGVADKANKQMGVVVDDMLYQNKSFDAEVINDINQSDYRKFSKLRYRRRLVEIHVVWVNTLFLVLGSALIVLDFGTKISNQSIDWMHLILFLVALRYAANGLQQMASATVAFSRFLPESEMVYQILNIKQPPQPDNISGLVFYFDSRNAVESLLPQILRQQYGVKNCALLENIKSLQAAPDNNNPDPLWVYAIRPVLFKQAVKLHQDKISAVICRIGSQIQRYDDVADFLKNFNPQQILKQSNQNDSDYDDEMY